MANFVTTSRHYCQKLVLLLIVVLSLQVTAEILPERLQVALIAKVLTMEASLAGKQDISIFVLNAPQIFKLLKQDEGYSIGNSTLYRVDIGTELPLEKYDVIYFGSYTQEAQAIAYAKHHGALSLYPITTGMSLAGSLGLGIKSGKPMFLLNMQQSQAERLNWNSTILNIAQIK